MLSRSLWLLVSSVLLLESTSWAFSLAPRRTGLASTSNLFQPSVTRIAPLHQRRQVILQTTNDDAEEVEETNIDKEVSAKETKEVAGKEGNDGGAVKNFSWQSLSFASLSLSW